jgi:hypothetical protein
MQYSYSHHLFCQCRKGQIPPFARQETIRFTIEELVNGKFRTAMLVNCVLRAPLANMHSQMQCSLHSMLMVWSA